MSKPPIPIKQADSGSESSADQGQASPATRHSGAQPGSGARSSWAHATSTSWTEAERAELLSRFRSVLERGMHGLCFSPYMEGQSPGSLVSEAQIRERLTIIRPYTSWIRTFSCTDGHEQTPRIAQQLGFKTLVGAWLGTDAEINEREIQGVIKVAQAGHADIVAVGNEVMLREDMSEDELIGFIERVKQAIPGVPVGYVDAYFLFGKHPRVTAACDVVLTNCYPFWEGCPREQALPYMQTMLENTRRSAPGKRIIISETGWPDRGSPFSGAVPTSPSAPTFQASSNEEK